MNEPMQDHIRAAQEQQIQQQERWREEQRRMEEEQRRQQELMERRNQQMMRQTQAGQAQEVGLGGSGGGGAGAGIASSFMGGGGSGAGAAGAGAGGAGAGAGAGAGGGGAAAGGSAGGGGGSMLASAGPWAALAAAIVINEREAKRGGYRDEDDWEYAKDLAGAKVFEQDMEKRWIPKVFGRDDKTGLGADMKAGAEVTTLDFSNAWKNMKNGSIGKALRKIF